MDIGLDHSLSAQLISATILGWFALAFVFFIAYKLGKEKLSRWHNFLIVGLGALIGWATGIMASPLDAEEGARFAKFGQLITAFSSGYLISKLDRFLEHSLFKDKEPVVKNWIYVALFCAAFVSSLIPSYVSRSYFHSLRVSETQSETKQESNKSIQPTADAAAD